jgi:hypothetical protein
MNEYDINWGHLGGVVDGKINFIRQVLNKYQVDKPLYHTEGALMCAEYNPADCDPPGDAFYAAQAEFAVRMYVQNWVNGVEATIWYQFEGPGWRHGGLLDSDQNPKPVYEAIRFMSSMLSGTSFTGNISPMEVLKGYEFISPEKRVWVLWSHEQVDIPFTLPEDVVGIFDIYGNQIGNEEKEIVVNSPIFIEMNQ